MSAESAAGCCRLFAKPGDLIEGAADVGERRSDPGEELRSGFGRRDAARRPCQQTDAQPLLETAKRMAERRRGHAELLCRSGETAFLCHREERRQNAELVADHS